MRQRDPLSPEESRELDALERALAGDPVDADLRELEQLVDDIRATAPEMSPGFAARLEHEVAEGFPATAASIPRRAARARRRWVLIRRGRRPRRRARGARRRARQRRRRRRRASTIAPTRSTADGVAAPRRRAGRRASADRGGAGPLPRRRRRASALARRRPPPPAAPRPIAREPGAGARARRRSAPPAGRARSSAARCSPCDVPNAKVDSTADGVIRTVDRFGGIVALVDSSATTGLARRGDVRAADPDRPARRGAGGAVAARPRHRAPAEPRRTSRARSRPREDRLSDARAERRGLLQALGRATTQQQIDSLQARLRNVRSRIARLNGDLAALRRRADLSTRQPRRARQRGRAGRRRRGRRRRLDARRRGARRAARARGRRRASRSSRSRSPRRSACSRRWSRRRARDAPAPARGRARTRPDGAAAAGGAASRGRATLRRAAASCGIAARMDTREQPAIELLAQRAGVRDARARATSPSVAAVAVPRTFAARARHLPRGRRRATRATSSAAATPARSASTATAARSTLAHFGPGDIFGELAMFDDERRSATVETLDERRGASRSSAPTCAGCCASTPTSRSSSSSRSAGGCARPTSGIARQSFQTVQSRVAGVLGQLVDQAQAEGAGDARRARRRSRRPTSPSSPAPRASRPAASSPCSSAPASSRRAAAA